MYGKEKAETIKTTIRKHTVARNKNMVDGVKIL